jgi:gluconokinase
VEKSPRHFEIVAVGITTFVMNLVGILSPSASTCSSFNDRDKMMLSHHNMSLVIDSKYTCSYACNTNSAQVKCRELHQLLGETRAWNLYQRTGAPIHVAYALGQLGDLYGTVNKNNNEKIVKWTSIASICIANWTGRDILSMPISYSEASWTGMFDFRSGTWDEECLSLLPVSCRDALPDVGEEVLEGLSDVYQKRWPEFRKDCKFVLGCGDGACANIGSKCTSVDRIAVTIGTSAAARLLLRLPLVFKDNKGCSSNNGVCNTVSNSDASLDEIPMGLFCYRIDQNHVLLGGALTDGGSVIAWLRKLLNLNSENEYEECQQKAFIQYMTKSAIGAAVTATATDSHENDAAVNSSKVLTFLPFLSGERSTGFRVGATGCISGILRSTTSVDLLQECLESVVLRIHAILELFQKAVMFDDVCSPTTIVASGNALEKNELWRKMLADCSNMTVVLDENTHEGTSRGAAIMVANALVDSYITEIPKEKLSISHQSIPDQSYRRYWHVKKEIQNKLIDTIESTWK